MTNNENVVAFPVKRLSKSPEAIPQMQMAQCLSNLHRLVSNIENYGEVILEPALADIKSQLLTAQIIMSDHELVQAK